jgi:hypothetical protein
VNCTIDGLHEEAIKTKRSSRCALGFQRSKEPEEEQMTRPHRLSFLVLVGLAFVFGSVNHTAASLLLFLSILFDAVLNLAQVW